MVAALSPAGSPREALSRLVLVVGSVLVTAGLSEVALRAAGYAPQRFKSTARLISADGQLLLDCYPTNPRGYFDIDLRQPVARARYERLAPHRFDAVARRAPWAVEFRYNSARFRGPEFGPKRAAVRRVAVLGDSFTEGQGVKEDDTYPRVLARLLEAAEPGRWEVLNCGRRATDFPALYQAFEEVLAYDPDIVVYGMVLNDPDQSPSFHARQSYVNDLILDRGRMLVGQPDYELGFTRSRLLAFAFDRVESTRITRESTRWYQEMYGPPNQEGWERTQGYLREMNARMRGRGGRFLLVLWPLLVSLKGAYPFAEASREIAGACLAAGIPWYDLLPALQERPTSSLWVHPVDLHPNEVAHGLAARSLAPMIRELVVRP